MAKKKQEAPASAPEISATPISLASCLSTKPKFQAFRFWVVGDTPLITHAWAEKSRREMLQKQIGATRGGREKRNPEEDFVSSLYEMGDGTWGFPATGVKKCILSAAHKDKGVPRSSVLSALWLDAHMIRTRPALAGAICDMPLIRVIGGKPEMREDMVKIGAGLNKTASLAYRGQFTVWAMAITGRFNASVLTAAQIAFLVQESGLSSGLGEWRNERHGMFGAFHLASVEEEKEWEAYAKSKGKGKLPIPQSYQMAAE